MITSAYMKLSIPSIGADPDPQWQSELVAALNKIDTHTHGGSTAGTGVQIPFNNLNFTATTPNMSSNPLIGVTYLKLTNLTSSSAGPTSAASTGSLWTDNVGGLWYTSTATTLLIATATTLQTGIATTKGFYGTEYAASFGLATSNATSVAFAPGYFSATSSFLGNIFSFYQGTTAPNATSVPAALLAGNIYAKGNSNPSFIVYDSSLANSSGGTGTGALVDKFYGIALGSLGQYGGGGVTSGMFGLNVFYTDNATGNYSSAAWTVWGNSGFGWTTAGTTIRPPVIQSFGAGLNEGLTEWSNSDVGTQFHFVEKVLSSVGSATGVNNFKSDYAYYLNSNTGAMSSIGTGFGVAYRLYMQLPGSTGAPGYAALNQNFNQLMYMIATSPLSMAYKIQMSNTVGLSTAQYMAWNTSGSTQYLFGADPSTTSPYNWSAVVTTGWAGFGVNSSMYVNGSIYPASDAGSATTGLTLGGSSSHWAALYTNAIVPSSTLTIAGNLTVTGTTSLASNFYTATGATTTISSSVGYFTRANTIVSCGSVSSTSGSGTITGFNVGTFSWTNATTCVVNFGTTLANAANCVGLAQAIGTGGNVTVTVSSVGTGSMTVYMNSGTTFNFAILGSAA